MLMLKPRQLTVLTTSQCTARCGHCSMNSSPERRDRLTADRIIKVVDELHGLSRLSVVIFAGGEPTLLKEQLLDAIAHCDGLGILTRIVTNASWATTDDRARYVLRTLREAGLAELNISADDFHLPFIPFENVERAWKASKGLGFLSVVIANCSGPKSIITPEYIMERLGETLPTRYDEAGHSQRVASPSEDGTTYSLSNAYVQRIGRGVDNVTLAELNLPASQEKLNVPCPWAVRSAALSPAGHLVACCGIEAEHNSVLDFGNVRESPAGDLVRKADDDVLVNAVALLGPMFLKRFVEQRAPEVPFREQYSTVCEVCEHVVGRRETLEVLKQSLPELAMHVLAARAASGELSSALVLAEDLEPEMVPARAV